MENQLALQTSFLEGLPPTDELLHGGPIPFFLGLVLVALLARRRSFDAFAAALAVGAGSLYFHVYLMGWLTPGSVPSFAAIRAEQWLSWLVLAGLGAGAVSGSSGKLLQTLIPMALGAAVVFLIQHPILKSTDAFAERAQLLGITFGLWALTYGGFRLAATRANSSRHLLVLLISTGVASAVIGMSGSRKLAQLAGAGVAALAATTLFARLIERKGAPRPDLLRGALGPAWTWNAALLLAAHHYAYLELDIALLVVAPALLVAPLALILRGRGLVSDGLAALLASSPAIVALVLAAMRFAEEPDYGGY